MGVATLISVEEYRSTCYHPDCDYVDGVLVERNVGEYGHSRLQMLLSAYFFSREKQWRIRVVPEQRVQITATRFRVPDVCVVDASAPIEQVFTRSILLCVEILSPEDRMGAMQEKINDYLAFGVPYVWVLDPGTRRAYIYTGAGMQELKDGVLRAGSQIQVPIAELFE